MTPGVRGRPAPVRPLLAVAALGALAGCTSTTAALACTAGGPRAVPGAIHETSGAAWSAHDAALFWTVNDGSEGALYAVDTTGTLVARVETQGGRLRDVEDLAGAPCPAGYCLYLADTGDNAERREAVAVHRVREPAPESGSADRTAFPMRFPDGPRDVEALIVLPGERIHLVTKGRNHAPTLYRYPGPPVPDSLVTLERLNALGTGPASFTGRITGASWIPGTEDLVMIRSYESLHLYRITAAGMERVRGGELTLRQLQEAQGEAVAAHEDGRVVLTSEAGPVASVGTFRILRCQVDTAGGRG